MSDTDFDVVIAAYLVPDLAKQDFDALVMLVADKQLEVEVARVHAAHYGFYGARKVWLQLNREGFPVARCTVERLMGRLDLHGAVRGKVKRTTIADRTARLPDDLEQRRFAPTAPDRQTLVVVGAVVAVVPLVIMLLALQRIWQSGLSAGAEK